jgi:hypothetical protein
MTDYWWEGLFSPAIVSVVLIQGVRAEGRIAALIRASEKSSIAAIGDPRLPPMYASFPAWISFGV